MCNVLEFYPLFFSEWATEFIHFLLYIILINLRWQCIHLRGSEESRNQNKKSLLQILLKFPVTFLLWNVFWVIQTNGIYSTPPNQLCATNYRFGPHLTFEWLTNACSKFACFVNVHITWILDTHATQRSNILNNKKNRSKQINTTTIHYSFTNQFTFTRYPLRLSPSTTFPDNLISPHANRPRSPASRQFRKTFQLLMTLLGSEGTIPTVFSLKCCL